MKLKKLHMQGFKSFADATTVEFHEGITAVVGPNGCGKSNISDAIRWVLGEQRPTAIRGAKMEEAIFQGSVNRRPVNRGSVSLTVTNEDGTLPVPFEEVEIGRDVYRDGGSDYSINRSTVRLRDVVDLYRDTGLGANAYAIIENRMIDAILSDRAEERRGLFEEAAGIGKYKDRRKAAVRRLERAEMDLQRLEDVISEVQTKVRSLARQKGKAQRYTEYRKRRLDVEVTVVRHQLEALQSRLQTVRKDLSGDQQTERGMAAELATAEAEYESLRLKEVEAEKERVAAAKILEGIREELVRWERDLAVADERAAYAERRLAQIGEDRTEARQRAGTLQEEASELGERREAAAAELGRHREVAEEKATEAAGVRERLQSARDAMEGVEAKGREIARKVAQLEGDAEASDAQAEELARRLEQVKSELSNTADTLSDLESQGDLFSGRLDELSDDLEAAESVLEAAASRTETAKNAFEEARRADREAADRVETLTSRVAALGGLERDQEGVEPVVRAALGRDDGRVLGALFDFIDADVGATTAVEAYLGPLASALVVRDRAALERTLAWFADEWEGGGGLIVLPLDRVPGDASSASGELLSRIRVSGEGAPWVQALLDGVDLPDTGRGDVPVTERGGVVRVGNPSGASGVLERKERLKRLRSELQDAEEEARKARKRRADAEVELKDAEEALAAARKARQVAEDEHRKVHGDLAEQADRRGRMDRLRDELSRQVEGTRAARTRAIERAREAREDRAVLLEQESGLQAERDEARARLEAVQEEWETTRAEEARLAVDVARLEGDLSRLDDRLEAVEAARQQAVRRVEALDKEEEGLKKEQAQVSTLREEGAAATEKLFAQRTAAEADLQAKDEALQEISKALREAEKRVREARTQERAATDRRHALELEQQELVGRVERIRDRLEGEWGRPLERLLEEAEPVEGEPEELERELQDLVVALDRIGPVNMLAVEEHAEESERLEFLTGQREDLVEARNDLRAAIREINKTATDLFMGTFGQIRENFRTTFLRLFEGGEADIWLQDEDDPLESPIEIHASPRGKKTQRIDLLSGGERALTALSLLFGIYLVKPSPFCVLDEVDAPLDENNIGRFIRLLQEFSSQTQFVVITHNPRTIEAADWIYGVTMEEPGVSTIVGVRLQEALQAAGAA
ncbi:MAG: chromosome segregation protein SMC [Longimicrobiales bacterium]|nr:chromosome segregation protein SMC [Longimicrobiales bacterium]